MNFKLTATKKTYYIVGGCSAALALAGAALYLPGYYFDLLFTVSAILAGAMFLLLAAGKDDVLWQHILDVCENLRQKQFDKPKERRFCYGRKTLS